MTHQAAHPESWIQAVCLLQTKENLEHKQDVLNKQIKKMKKGRKKEMSKERMKLGSILLNYHTAIIL